MAEYPRIEDLHRDGDVYGEPNAGHRVELISAAVVIYPDGSEGLVSAYTFLESGAPAGRVTFVTSDPKMLPILKQALAVIEPPTGGRFEWREYHLA